MRLDDQFINTHTEVAADLEPKYTNCHVMVLCDNNSWGRSGPNDVLSLTLGEHLPHDQPRDGPVTQGEEHHKK